MVLNKKERKISYGIFVKREIHLMPQEIKVIEVLSDKKMHSVKEILEKTGIKGSSNLRTVFHALREKKLKLYNEWGKGYILDNDIRIVK